ncbi:DUF6177 family protein [Jatrophihabitans fulvus]
MSAPHPAVDVVTSDSAVMLSNRTVVGLSSWLVDAVVGETRAGRVPVLVTGPDGRVTPAVRALAMSGRLHWVVQLPDGRIHDAASGIPLGLEDGRVVVPDTATAAVTPPVPEFEAVADADREAAAWQVIVAATVEHRADVHTRVGDGIEALSRVLTAAPPAGWGLYEPVTESWRPSDLTAFARRRMPDPTQFVVVTPAAAGRSLLATVLVQRTDRGVEEQIDAVASVGSLDLAFDRVVGRSVDALLALGEAGTVGFAWTYARPGAADLTEVPRRRAAPLPTAVLVGPRAVRALGADRAREAPLPPPRTVGRPRVPGLVWAIGADGRDPWDDVDALVRHLGPQRIVEVSPAFAQMLGIA